MDEDTKFKLRKFEGYDAHYTVDDLVGAGDQATLIGLPFGAKIQVQNSIYSNAPVYVEKPVDDFKKSGLEDKAF